MAQKRGPKRIKTTGTVFDIVEHVKSNTSCTLTDIATDLDISKSTVHAHLQTLRDRGYVIEEDGEYRLGLRFFSLGGHVRQNEPYGKLYQMGKPEIDELVETTDERAQIVVEEQGFGFYLYQARGNRAVLADTHTGTRIPLHSTAVGKAILSTLPEERVETIVSRHGLPADTPRTTTDPDELFDELDRIRDRGCAFDRGERVVGVRCVAAPIELDELPIAAGVSVSIPKLRRSDTFFEDRLPELVANAARIIGLNTTYY